MNACSKKYLYIYLFTNNDNVLSKWSVFQVKRYKYIRIYTNVYIQYDCANDYGSIRSRENCYYANKFNGSSG